MKVFGLAALAGIAVADVTMMDHNSRIQPRFSSLTDDKDMCVTGSVGGVDGEKGIKNKGGDLYLQECSSDEDSNLYARQQWSYNSDAKSLWTFDGEKYFCWTVSNKVKKLKRKTLGMELRECDWDPSNPDNLAYAVDDQEKADRQGFNFDDDFSHIMLAYEKRGVTNKCVQFDWVNKNSAGNGQVLIQSCGDSNWGVDY